MPRTRYRHDDGAASRWPLLGAALRAVAREGYSFDTFRSDLLAGVIVGVVALPLAMALAVGVGVPPQHGLYTAIIAGFVTALAGGSRFQVSGPTAAFIVILAPIYAKFGLGGLLLSGFLGGLLLVLFGLARLGKAIEYIPYPVTTGFTAGIATVIATLQVKDLLGLKITGTAEHFIDHVSLLAASFPTASLAEATVGAFTLSVLVLAPRLVPRVPAPLLALPLGAALAALLPEVTDSETVATISSRFTSVIGNQQVMGIPQVPPLPVWPLSLGGGTNELALDLATLRQLLPGAFAIALLGAIESLLSAVVADGMARTRHDSDAELVAQGLANLIAPFFGGIPSTGAIARTATNIRSGARSPVAAMIHSVFILLAVIAFAQVLGYIPMASLAALLLLVAWRMSEVKHFIHMLRVAPRSDVAVLLACFLLTVAVDMVIGVFVGVVLASFLFMKRMATTTDAREILDSTEVTTEVVPPGVALYEISGPLFFGAAQRAMSRLHTRNGEIRAVVILMRRVEVVDATGMVALESAIEQLRTANCAAVLCEVKPGPKALLLKSGVVAKAAILAPTLENALAQARELVRARVGN